MLAITFKAHNGEQQQLKFRYDALDQLLSESSDAGDLQYAYDALGNLETLTRPDQRQLNLNGRVICDFGAINDEVLRTQGSLLACIQDDRSGRFSQKGPALHGDDPFLTGQRFSTGNLMIDASWQALHSIVPLFSRPRKIVPTPSPNTSDGPI
nr:RHS repeat domain-containing protein [Pseudomonas fluorescens]